MGNHLLLLEVARVIHVLARDPHTRSICRKGRATMTPKDLAEVETDADRSSFVHFFEELEKEHLVDRHPSAIRDAAQLLPSVGNQVLHRSAEVGLLERPLDDPGCVFAAEGLLDVQPVVHDRVPNLLGQRLSMLVPVVVGAAVQRQVLDPVLTRKGLRIFGHRRSLRLS